MHVCGVMCVCVRVRVVLFRSVNDVMNANPTLHGQPVLWDSPEGQSLLKLLPPTADIVNFRIAHEVAHLMKHDWIWSVLLAPAMLILGYHMTVFLCRSKCLSIIIVCSPSSLCSCFLR